MTAPTASSGSDNDNVRYEQVDDLTVNVYVEGPGDTTARPAHPAVQQMLKRDREQIAQMIARTRCEQEALNARAGRPNTFDEPNEA